jgi:predicted small secreted protein
MLSRNGIPKIAPRSPGGLFYDPHSADHAGYTPYHGLPTGGIMQAMKTNIKHVLLLIAAIAFAVVAFSGCQTTEGVGRDIENLGESIQS